LINSESSNYRGQPKMGTAFTAEQMASTWMSQCIERTKKVLECKQSHPMTMKHQRGGNLCFKKQVRCIAYHLTSHALHNCFADISRNNIPTGIQRDSHELKFF
jgi:hypothetical protein